MTKEEAKEIFLNRGFINGLFDGDKWRESIVIISEWLEQEPEHLVNESGDLVKDLVKDTISRQTVLNKIKEVCFSEEWLQFRVDNGSNGQRDFLINYIKQLPPVNSQEPVLDKIRAEIETKYGQCDICEYFENYDYEENDISEYRPIGDIADILQIIDKYKAESEDMEVER